MRGTILASEGNLVVVDFGGTGGTLNKRQLAHALGRSLRWVEERQAEGMPFTRDHRGWCKFVLSECQTWFTQRTEASSG